MEWRDDGIVIGQRRLGETSGVLEVMTRRHGRCAGVVHGARSKSRAPWLQAGNTLSLHWRARLHEHLGTLTPEPRTLRAGAMMESEAALLIAQTLADHYRLLPERDPHPGLFTAGEVVLDALDDPEIALALLVRFEVELLRELGAGLQLDRCAVTGAGGGNAVLAHVSPKSGRAVSEAEGAPYAARLLRLPGFLLDPHAPAGAREIAQGLALTDHFMARHAYAPDRPEPYSRERLRALISGLLAGEDGARALADPSPSP